MKPFSPKELVARVKAILRRTNEHELRAEKVLFAGGLVIDTFHHEVTRNGNLLSLTPNEYKLLTILSRNPDRPFTRDELITKLSDENDVEDIRVIDQHIKNLRHKIEPYPKEPHYIKTVFGIGYKFAGRTEK